MSGEVIAAAAAALLLFWSVGAYNRLVRLRSQALQAFGALTVQLRRRQALGEVVPMTSGDSLQADGAAVPAPSALNAAAQQFGASVSNAQAHPLDARALRSLGAANAVLLMAWDRHFGDASDIDSTASLIAQWNAVAAQLTHANDEFDQAASRYNAAVRQFPAQIVAAVFGLRLAGYFEM